MNKDKMNKDEMIYCQETIDLYNRGFEEDEQGSERTFPPWENYLIPYLKTGDHILDLGCGDGHYGKIFQDLGYEISALDASESLCKMASERLGKEVRNIRFDQLEDLALYDAVWACCSLLHIPRRAMPDAFFRIARALKPGAYVYASFKEGEEDCRRNVFGSYMADMTEESMRAVLEQVPSLQIIEVERTPFQNKEDQAWIHFILKKDSCKNSPFPADEV